MLLPKLSVVHAVSVNARAYHYRGWLFNCAGNMLAGKCISVFNKVVIVLYPQS